MKLAHLFCLLSIHLAAELPPSLKNIPSTKAEVITYADATSSKFLDEMSKFKAISPSHRTFDNTVVAWNQMMESLWAKTVELAFLSIAVNDPDALNQAQREAMFLTAKLQNSCRDKEALQIFIDFAESKPGKSLTPAESYELSQLLSTAGVTWETKKMLPYTSLKGKQSPTNNKAITVLNWNVCFFPSNLSLFFGGVLPWQDRIEKVAETIQKSNADLVCLQEVFLRDAALSLYDHLKDDYAYFYINIGCKPFGFNPDLLGLSSGLFVASKYKLENPEYIPFKTASRSHGYGFFLANLPKGKTIISTHLTPGIEASDQTIRQSQIDQILSFATKSKKPSIFLCGDLNIEFTSPEYKNLISPNFINYYIGTGWTCLELRDFWWKAKQNVENFLSLKIPTETIDYFLRIKTTPTPLTVTTEIIEVNNPREPQNALSDHQALLSTIQ